MGTVCQQNHEITNPTPKTATAPKTTEKATAPKTTEKATAPKTIGKATAPKTTEKGTVPKTTEKATAPKTTEKATASKTTEKFAKKRTAAQNPRLEASKKMCEQILDKLKQKSSGLATPPQPPQLPCSEQMESGS